ncbi:ABC transporter ATP-binding protein [Allorhodopirellula solitaria]|uniref:Putative ABC transporter ATP-binding protein YxlF n=1 Tax=Allorhodopirellula solitaria TaxID=2527987 RepID=A0A5C5YKE0_9BACT|nr:ABC transporter ATP-binding protein [Allorhodopirellula solitaria]TWT75289.1 putative ABC transporter ATP-binding protein YxlF [Allorhodopirellula solitaria]
MASSVSALQSIELSKRFRSNLALDSVTIRIDQGKTVGLLGINGAGKSTLLKLAVGNLRPSGGELKILGLDPQTMSHEIRARVGFVPEASQFYKWMTVGQILNFVRPMYSAWDEPFVGRLSNRFNLDLKRRVSHLSSGMLAKLSLLVALGHQPELLILDEPLTGMDPLARQDFTECVAESVFRDSQTVLFSSHQLDEVSELADEVIIIHEGRVLVHRAVADLVNTTRRIRVIGENLGSIPIQADHVVCRRKVQSDWIITVSDFDPAIVASMAEDGRHRVSDVSTVSLSELFKDYVRGVSPSEGSGK